MFASLTRLDKLPRPAIIEIYRQQKAIERSIRMFASLEDGPLLRLPPSEGPLSSPSADIPHNDVLGVVGVIHRVTERHQVPGERISHTQMFKKLMELK